MVAVALLDGQMTPSQYLPERIAAPDVQTLLQRIEVHTDAGLTAAFPPYQGVRLEVRLADGSTQSLSRPDYRGPSTWQEIEAKYTALGGPVALIELTRNLDEVSVAELVASL